MALNNPMVHHHHHQYPALLLPLCRTSTLIYNMFQHLPQWTCTTEPLTHQYQSCLMSLHLLLPLHSALRRGPGPMMTLEAELKDGPTMHSAHPHPLRAWACCIKSSTPLHLCCMHCKPNSKMPCRNNKACTHWLQPHHPILMSRLDWRLPNSKMIPTSSKQS